MLMLAPVPFQHQFCCGAVERRVMKLVKLLSLSLEKEQRSFDQGRLDYSTFNARRKEEK